MSILVTDLLISQDGQHVNNILWCHLQSLCVYYVATHDYIHIIQDGKIIKSNILENISRNDVINGTTPDIKKQFNRDKALEELGI